MILDGLSKLEYRGYDSAGMAVFDGERIQTKKATGRLKVLENLTRGGEDMPGHAGIGHTRWATHGAPSDLNAHPHTNGEGTIAVVHNGIIENYIPLKKKMEGRGYAIVSNTDTEVLAHLLDYYYKGNPLETIIKVLQRVEGSYALGIMFADHPGELYAARKDSPLIVGRNQSGCFIASDVPAILKYTRTVYYMDNQEVVVLKEDDLSFYSMDEEEVAKEAASIDWDASAAEKAGYEHFMLKEMYEQPKTVADTLSPRVREKKTGRDICIDELNMTDEELRAVTKLHIVACGSAYHAGVTGKYVLEGLARIPVEVDLASEFRYREPLLEEGCMVIVISQSGETADTLAALRDSKAKGFPVLGIVNVVGSSIAREADACLYTWAGPEIAIDYAISLEGSLKLKEISYIHSEAYAAGELKHGTISLIEEGTLVVAVSTQPKLYQKTLSNIVEVKARGAFVMAVTNEENRAVESVCDYCLYLPETNPCFTNSLAIIPLQLFAYYVAVGRGCDVDKPRNLAKSVTVE